MIIAGIKYSQVHSEHIFENCPKCGKQGSVSMNIDCRYLHLFWIPTIPLGKTASLACDACSYTAKKKEMPASFALHYDTVKAQAQIPWWHFSGLGLIAILAVVGVFTTNQRNERIAAYVKEPKAGDLYTLRTLSSGYTYYKVHHLSGDTVFVLHNNYEATTLSKLHKSTDLLEEKNFDSELQAMMKAEMVSLWEKGRVYDIERSGD